LAKIKKLIKNNKNKKLRGKPEEQPLRYHFFSTMKFLEINL